ncbi:Putative phage intergrase [Moritella viscosa]|uniref:Phage intergrase n=5 Tax=Moritella viscosa TaxID=80854 RepID=A0ABY1HKB0_9GAMM|nr:Putative phage intergrase [Moritella viscosa]
MLFAMSQKELNRVDVIRDVCEKRLTQVNASNILNLTRRQVQRLVNNFRKNGAQGLASLRRGKPSNRQFSPAFKQNALRIIKDKYADFGPTFANEKLLEQHGIKLSAETLRHWMIDEGLWKSREKPKTKTYQPRYRRESLGELVQIDGSHHDWFEGRAEKCCLLVFIDDATGRLMTLRFSEVESTYDYMNATREYIEQHGKPVAFYSDKHSVFRINKKAPLSGNQMTQYGRALYELNIDLICANSSQAKGRVERANKTLQDRLIKEMRLAGIDSMEQANAWLPIFIEDFNHRFGRAPHSLEEAHRLLRESSEELDDIFARQKTRKVSNALTLQYDKVVYLIEPTDATARLAGKNVMIYDYPDGTLSIKHCGKALPYQVFDKLRQVNQGTVVDNKRLGAALSFAKRSQEERNDTLERTRSAKTFSRTAQKRARQINPILRESLEPDK